MWGYVKTLPNSFNTLKAHVLYLRLDHDRKKGVFNNALFLEYFKLPASPSSTNCVPRLPARARRRSG